jgi:hypothetical protein
MRGRDVTRMRGRDVTRMRGRDVTQMRGRYVTRMRGRDVTRMRGRDRWPGSIVAGARSRLGTSGRWIVTRIVTRIVTWIVTRIVTWIVTRIVSRIVTRIMGHQRAAGAGAHGGALVRSAAADLISGLRLSLAPRRLHQRICPCAGPRRRAARGAQGHVAAACPSRRQPAHAAWPNRRVSHARARRQRPGARRCRKTI